MPMKKINNARSEIDRIDSEVLKLINQRAKFAHEIGLKKKENDTAHYVPEREMAILDKLVKLNEGPVSGDALRVVFREIISACRSLEGELKIGFLGPEATYSHQAAIRKFGSMSTFVSCRTIKEVFSAVNDGKVEYGIVPIENSNAGIVGYTIDMFLEWDLKISAEHKMEISNHLFSLSGDKSKVKSIYSHPQPIAQCREWISSVYPAASVVEVSSTAKASEICQGDDSAAAIAGKLAGKMYGLKTVNEGIEDNSNNITRFLIISNDVTSPTGNDKTSILFSIDDKPGTLGSMLQILSDNGINLSKIESRPSRKQVWEYLFYVDFCGHMDEPAMSEAIVQMKKKATYLKVLGSYPAAIMQR